jgi:4-amino-4-deoxychorismate lyase
LYDFDQYDREFVPYRLPSIKTLNPVWTDDIDYSCKWTDRTRLQALAEQKGEAGDVLIVKNGLVTDTSFANLVFFDGNSWLTPETPLLKGTQRAFLLDQGLIEEQRITYEDLDRFEEIRIINAMIRLEDQLSVVILKR